LGTVSLGMEGDLQRVVGQNLRTYREARGLSQEAFADVLCVHRTYMGGVERGERNLTLKTLERLAERLHLDPLALLGKQDGLDVRESSG
jgi:transcriptional regulator with XRE-family HTH domain